VIDADPSAIELASELNNEHDLGADMLVGRSVLMCDLRSRLTRMAVTNFTVLIEGESGAGKELVAREIHLRSPRHRGPFVAVNCAALVESLVEAELFGIEERTATGVRGRRGKFELAEGGTLFLDEVGDLSATAQAKLLRVLQDMVVERVGGNTVHAVDARIVAATNRSLQGMVGTGRFRADLYYRIAGVEVFVPPLRARREDIPLLVDHFLAKHRPGPLLRMSPAALEAMVAFEWPGNVRQLARTLERVVALAAGPEITFDDLPGEVTRQYAEVVVDAAPQHPSSLRAWSSRYVRVVLQRCNGNKRRACDILDISYHTLQSHLEYEVGPALRAAPPADAAAATDEANEDWCDAAS
jgi:transcriptional regulator with PAS, ATPase and Fis domain